MQVLFSFDRGMRVEKNLMQTFASQLSCKLSFLNSQQLSCELSTTLMRTLASQLSTTLDANSQQLSCELSLLNSQQLLMRTLNNSHANSRFSTLMQTLASRLSYKLSTLMQTLASQLSWELSLLSSHQLSCKLPLLFLVRPRPNLHFILTIWDFIRHKLHAASRS
jgi:hypothetical protein